MKIINIFNDKTPVGEIGIHPPEEKNNIVYTINPSFSYPTGDTPHDSIINRLEPWVGNGFFATANGCFERHWNFVLSPDHIWFIILKQIAICIIQNKETYEWIAEDQKDRTIEVGDDNLLADNNWLRALGKFLPKMKEKLPPQFFNALTAEFSTTGELERVVHITALMDVIQPYYKYSISSFCGIPKVKLLGTPEDWKLIETKVVQMKALFPELKNYFDTIIPTLEIIAQEAETEHTPDLDFWKSIFTRNNDSRSPYLNITGWLGKFVAYLHICPRNQSSSIPEKKSFVGKVTNIFPKEETGEQQPKKPYYLLREDFSLADLCPRTMSPMYCEIPIKWKTLTGETDLILTTGFFGNSYERGFFKPEFGLHIVSK